MGRCVNGRFAKGTSGNPSGRPKRTEAEQKTIADICLLAPIAVKTLKKVLKDENTPPNVRIKAAEIILDRVCGKPLTTKELDDYDFNRENVPRIVIDVLKEGGTHDRQTKC